MTGSKFRQHHGTGWDIVRLLLMWLLSAVAVVAWIQIDQAPPAWDQGDHLSRAIDHWRLLQHPQWFSAQWWRELWIQAPTQRGPVTYLLTVPFFSLFGPGFDQGIAANLLFTLILVSAIYIAGRRLFSATTGLWAAGLMLLSPVLLDLQNNYLLDFPMTAMVALMFAGMTLFWFAEQPLTRWLTIPLLGIPLGLALMTRTSGLLFVVLPVLWMLGSCLWQRRWLKLGQVCLGLLVGLGTLWPWFSTNWLTVISTTLASNSHGTRYRGDPQATSLAGWLFYPERLPHLLSWPLFCLAVLAIFLLIANRTLTSPQLNLSRQPTNTTLPQRQVWIWLSVFISGAYLLFSLGSYKALRVFIPCMPVLWVALAQPITLIQNRWWRGWRWGSVGVATVFALVQLFGNKTYLEQAHTWSAQSWPNQAIISEIVQTSPYLKTNVGIAAHTAQFNAFTMDFYGATANFHVFARELSSDPNSVPQDIEALDWYLTQTGDQGLPESFAEGPKKLLEAIISSNTLSHHRSWSLPDNTTVSLYHRNKPPITVEKIEAAGSSPPSITVSQIPSPMTPDGKYPITYTVQGSGKALQSGLLLLTWEPDDVDSDNSWVSDHAIGLGYLNTAPFEEQRFSVTEHLLLRPPSNAVPGQYHLNADYLDRATQTVFPIGERLAQVEIIAAAASAPPDTTAPETPDPETPDPETPDPETTDPETTVPETSTENAEDLFTYFNTELAPNLATGELDPVFYHVGRINQYDPRQDYLTQVEQAMTYRLEQKPERTDWLYSLALSHVLQQEAPQATQALQRLAEIAPKNPNHWAYLGFVHLYRWQPGNAERALDQAEQIQPDLPNLKLLQTVTAAMKLNIPKAVRLARSGL
ncbi:MAG: glycosyltransferase family 39 protein [Cyanobacteria bacterium J06632_22]